MNENATEIIETDTLDQTRFAEEAVILPNPPAKPAAAQRKRSPLLLLALVVPVLFGLFVVSLTLMQRQSDRQTAPASATPVPAAGTPTEIERRFDQLSSDIQAADPASFTLAFPPVDFTLDLQDASQLQLRRR